jgi:PhnB protein
MSDAAAATSASIPDHLGSVTARLVVEDAAAAVDFYRRVFGAEEIGARFVHWSGQVIHAEVRIGDSVVMITAEAADVNVPARSPRSLGGCVSAIMATYWDDVDSAWERAVAGHNQRIRTSHHRRY